MVNLGKITTTNSFPAKSTRVLGGILALTNKAYLDRIRTTYYIEEHTLLEEHTTESLLPNIKVTPGQYKWHPLMVQLYP